MRTVDPEFLNTLNLTTDLGSTLHTIGEHKGRQELFERQTPEVLDTLRRVALIESSESSNRIEGIVARLMMKGTATVVMLGTVLAASCNRAPETDSLNPWESIAAIEQPAEQTRQVSMAMDASTIQAESMLSQISSVWDRLSEETKDVVADKIGTMVLPPESNTELMADLEQGLTDQDPTRGEAARDVVFRGVIPQLIIAGVDRTTNEVPDGYRRISKFLYVESGLKTQPDFRKRFREEVMPRVWPEVLDRLDSSDARVGRNAVEMLVNFMADEDMSEDAARDTRLILGMVGDAAGLSTKRKVQIAYAAAWAWSSAGYHPDLVDLAEQLGRSLTYSNVEQLQWINELRGIGGGLAILAVPVVTEVGVRLFDTGEDKNLGVWALAHTYVGLRGTVAEEQFDTAERLRIKELYEAQLVKIEPVLRRADADRQELRSDVQQVLDEALVLYVDSPVK